MFSGAKFKPTTRRFIAESVLERLVMTNLRSEIMIAVKRDRDGKVFSNDMSEKESIYEIHFSTSYTQVKVQELDENGGLVSCDIICRPFGARVNWVDLIATQPDDTGFFLYS